ncbi:FkbM family methyltransferase [Thalassobaculum sp.]|uniref:FkbM family methyltransferase n=1 Tax=Thalassobaculum sp. TaxID=2022740 RepID=UPI0032EADBFB
MKKFDAAAIASDVARTAEQARLRDAAELLVEQMRLNDAGPFATEFVQALRPVATLNTPDGPVYFRGGHGRLLWRVDSFFEEEPDTIAWLDAMTAHDVLWDVGSNVGMYSMYAAKLRGSTVYAFEPESQNYATLCENVALNDVGERCFPVMAAVSRRAEFGELAVRYLTKGGAYNQFTGSEQEDLAGPTSAETAGSVGPSLRQVVYGISLDELLADPFFKAPTRLKIDVDGREADIFEGAGRLLRDRRLRGIMVELNRSFERDMAIPSMLAGLGFAKTAERSNWDYREDRSRESEYPTVNMIFARD